jgi:hypothetical protein
VRGRVGPMALGVQNIWMGGGSLNCSGRILSITTHVSIVICECH